MKKAIKPAVIIAAVVLIAFLVLYFNNSIGTPMSSIEKDARTSQAIPEDWQVAIETTESISAMIFYSKSLDDSTYSIYVNRPGFSFGYFFRAGGFASEIEQSVAEFCIEEYVERVFISMNKQKVNKIEYDDGNSVETIDIDSEKPFAVIVPANAGNVTIYDAYGNVVECVEREL